VDGLKAQLGEMDQTMSPEMKILQHNRERAVKSREELAKGGPDGVDQAKLKGLDDEIVDYDKQIAKLDPERHSVSTQLNAANDKLGKLNQGEGLAQLKPDVAQNALKTFKANSVGAKLMETKGLSETMQFKLGVKLKPTNTEGGPSKINVGSHRQS
jgi:hypothetical protein